MLRPAAWPAVVVAALVACAPAGAASPRQLTLRVHGHTVTATMHVDTPLFGRSAMSDFTGSPDAGGPISDPREQVVAHAAPGAPPLLSLRASPAPPTTWCGTSRTTDDVTDQLSDAPRYKVIYAYPRDAPNNLGTYGSLIQRAATWVADGIANSDGGLRAPRFDYGLACDPLALDITTIQLPQTLNHYQSTSPDPRAAELYTEITAAIGGMQLGPGEWNYLVFADHVAPGSQASSGLINHDDRHGAVNDNNAGGLIGIVMGGGGPNFMGAASEDYLAFSATHETGHTLGAVQNSAPHATGAGHCTDGRAIMCYDDHGPNGDAYTALACPVPDTTINSYTGVPFDCNSDDYISASPAAGSYLADYWNIFDSVFMCDTSMCTSRQSAPTAHLQMDPATPRPGQTVALSGALSTDPDSNITGYAFDTDDNATEDYGAPAASATTTFAAPAALGGHVVRLQVTDSTGLTGSTSLTYAVAGDPVPPGSTPPGSQNSTPNSNTSNTPGTTKAGTAKISRIIHNHHGITMVTVSCPSTAGACKGTVKITYAKRTRSATYSVAAGKRKQLKITPPAGITVHRVLSAKVVIRNSSDNRDVSRKLQLKP